MQILAVVCWTGGVVSVHKHSVGYKRGLIEAFQFGYRSGRRWPSDATPIFSIGQIRQDDKANVVLGKTLSVLSQTELSEPVCNLLHRGSPTSTLTTLVRRATPSPPSNRACRTLQ